MPFGFSLPGTLGNSHNVLGGLGSFRAAFFGSWLGLLGVCSTALRVVLWTASAPTAELACTGGWLGLVLKSSTKGLS